MIGTLLHDRYKIESVLGEGGMGVVYRAQDTLLQRPVAIKTLAPTRFGDEGARRILREAQSVAGLHHPRIVSIFDVVSETGSYAIVMEYVEGQTLRELIPVPIPQLLEITDRILEALEYAHGRGVIHRDIKPENIIIGRDGAAKLMDFGLARSEGRSRLTQTGMIVGTVAYLPPEQALGGQVDARSDLYSLGAVLYEALTGHPPFESEDPIAVITQHINVPPVAPHWHTPAIPTQLEQVILKLLNKDPLRRYQSAGEVQRALTNVAPSEEPGRDTLNAAGPQLIERIARSPLIGRDAELRRFKEIVDQTLAGRGGVALVAGSLGVGKTRLMEEGATFARLRGATVIAGKAYDSAPPYEPFARALRELARGVDSETLAARLGDFAPELIGLIPELARQLPRIPERTGGSQEERRSRLFAGVAHFLAASAVVAPVVVLLDDMHLADPGSSELLQHVARRADASRTLIVVGYRPDDLPATPAGKLFGQIVHALTRETFCTPIALQPLSKDQVIDLITLMANHRTRPQRFGQRIYDVTEGNPYFFEEVIKGLFERGVLYIKDGQWSTDFDDAKDYSMLEIPSSVHGAVESRLRTLREETRQVLLPAAVIGRQFGFDVLQAVTGQPEEDLLDRIEEAVRAQLIREVRGSGEDLYEFAQPMLRQVLYDSIPRRRRRLSHRQVGEALERAAERRPDPYLEALAMHFAEAEDTERAIRYARLAARKAAAVYAYDNAARFLQDAIDGTEELDRPADRVALLEELGDMRLAAGRRDGTIRAYEGAVQLWKSLSVAANSDGARLYRKLGELCRWGWYNPKTREHIQEGLRLLSDAPDSPDRVKLVVAQASDYYWLRPEAEADYAAAETSAREGFRLAQAIGSAEDMSAALDALAGIYWQTAQFPKMRAVTEERGPIGEGLGYALERLDYLAMLARAHAFLGEFAASAAVSQPAYAEADRRSLHLSLLHISADQAGVHVLWNRWEEAERWCSRYEENERRAGYESPLHRRITSHRAKADAVRGNTEAALEALRAIPDMLSGHPALAWSRPFGQLIPAIVLGGRERCAPLLEEALRLADTPYARLEVQCLALEYAARFQEWRIVDEFGDDTLARARRSEGPLFIARCCRALATHRRALGRLDEADAFVTEGIALFRRLDCPWELGLALRELALLRMAQSRAQEAADALREALTLFDRNGARPDAEQIRALLQ